MIMTPEYKAKLIASVMAYEPGTNENQIDYVMDCYRFEKQATGDLRRDTQAVAGMLCGW